MVVSEDSAVQRFESAHSLSQETIETISLWILHYKDKQSIEAIVSGWLKVFKKARSETHRIALFYIMNDAVQKAKNKHLDYFVPAFQPAVLSAITAARDSVKVKAVMDRVIGIFRERGIFTTASVTAMYNILHGAETGEMDDGCLEINSDELCSNIESFEKGMRISDGLHDLVKKTRFETFAMLKNRMPDKRAAYEELMKTRAGHDVLVDVRHSLEAHKKRMLELVETLEIAKRIHAHSLREVAVVEDAYLKFYQSIMDTEKELKEMTRTGVYPAATPPRDCPSPTANDDYFAPMDAIGISGHDNHIATDMDMEMDDEEIAPARAPQPPPPVLAAPGLIIPTPTVNFSLPPPSWSAGAAPPPPPLPFTIPPPTLLSPGTLAQPPPPPTATTASIFALPPGTFPNGVDRIQMPAAFTSMPPPPLPLNLQAFGAPSSSGQMEAERRLAGAEGQQQQHRFTPYNGPSPSSSRQQDDRKSSSSSSYKSPSDPRRDSHNRGGQRRDYRGSDNYDGGGGGGGRRDSWDRGSDRRDRGAGYRGGGRGGRGSGNGYRNERW